MADEAEDPVREAIVLGEAEQAQEQEQPTGP